MGCERIDTVDGLFLRALEQFPSRVFLRVADAQNEPTSYQQAAVRLARMVQRLEAMGLGTGDRVVCFADEAVPAIYLRLSCALAGVAAAFLPAASSIEALSQLVARLQAKAVFTTPEHAPRLAAGELRPVVLDDDRGGDAEAELGAHEALAILRGAASRHGANDIHHIQPTSGSTGQPKLVLRTHRSLVRGVPHMTLGISPHDEPQQRFLLVCSLNHGLAQIVLATALGLAAELSVPRQIDAAASLQEVRSLDPTYLVITPRVLRSFYQQHRELAQNPELERIFGPSARILMIGGGSADPRLLAMAAAQGLDVIDMYATTETGILAITPRGKWREKGSTKLVSDIEAKISEDGELLVRSPGQMIGYYADEPLTHAAFTRDGFYRTGDLASIGPNGYLQLLGRKRDVFNTNTGSNIYPARIEELLETLPSVRQAFLVGDHCPFLAALLVVAMPDDVASRGYLDPTLFRELYERTARDIATINAKLEHDEKVRRFLLLDQAFSSGVYQIVGHGKVNRNRRAFARSYERWIQQLYADTSPAGALVPSSTA